MPQVVSLHSVTTEAHVVSQARLCGNCGGRSGPGTGFLSVPQFSPVDIIPSISYTRSSLIYSWCCVVLGFGRTIKHAFTIREEKM
jgi:hypothetical protein